MCPRERGNYARFEAATLTHVDPAAVDVRCIDCLMRDERVAPCANSTGPHHVGELVLL